MAQSVVMTGSLRNVHGSFVAFEDYDALYESFEDLQASLAMLDIIYRQVNSEDWLVCPSSLHRGLDAVVGHVRQHMDSVEFYLRQMGRPIGRIIERDDSWPGSPSDSGGAPVEGSPADRS